MAANEHETKLFIFRVKRYGTGGREKEHYWQEYKLEVMKGQSVLACLNVLRW